MTPRLSDSAVRFAWPAAAGLVGLAALFVHALGHLPFIADDALISLRYARRLLDGAGLTWTDGEWVEGYSNLLWVLLCAALGRFGIDLVDAARFLGLTSSTLACLAFLRPYRPRDAAGLLPAAAGGLALGLSGSIAVWSVGGLEQPLLAALLCWALVLCYPLLEEAGPPRPWVLPSLLLALLCWTRPDGALFTVAVCAGLVAAKGAGRTALHDCARLASLPVAAYLAQLAFRWVYYGEWFPNSAYAKLAFGGERVIQGLRYLGGGAWWSIGLLLPALLVSVIRFRRGSAPRRVLFLAAPLLIWSAYVVAIGGDLFPARRHLVPVVLILALLLADGLQELLRRGSRARTAAWVGVPLALVALAAMQQIDPENLRAREERWEWDGQAIGELLRTAFGEIRPLLATDPGGTLPYFSQLPSIDMLGINDYFLARHRPREMGSGWLGHELGNGAYVLDREPDLVLFCGPEGNPRPCFRSGKEMVRDPRFLQRYRLVNFQAERPYSFRSRIWVRADGGKLGIAREADRVSVPGYLLSDNPESLAVLDPRGTLGVLVSSEVPAGIVGLPLGPGRWRLHLETGGGPALAELRAARAAAVLRGGPEDLEFRLTGDEDESVDLIVFPAGVDPIYLYRLVFVRIARTDS